jgi:uncharacterized membrane protein
MKKNDVHYMRGDACHCSCCMWHRNPVIKIILACLFLAMIADLTLQVVLGTTAYLTQALLSFVGVVLLIVFIGWVVSMGCQCKGRHWIHAPDEDALSVLQVRYAKGEVNKKQYQEIAKEILKSK